MIGTMPITRDMSIEQAIETLETEIAERQVALEALRGLIGEGEADPLDEGAAPESEPAPDSETPESAEGHEKPWQDDPELADTRPPPESDPVRMPPEPRPVGKPEPPAPVWYTPPGAPSGPSSSRPPTEEPDDRVQLLLTKMELADPRNIGIQAVQMTRILTAVDQVPGRARTVLERARKQERVRMTGERVGARYFRVEGTSTTRGPTSSDRTRSTSDD